MLPHRSLLLEFYRLKKDQQSGSFVLDETNHVNELDVFFFVTADNIPDKVRLCVMPTERKLRD